MQTACDFLSNSAHALLVAEFGQPQVREGLGGVEVALAGRHCFAVEEARVDGRWQLAVRGAADGADVDACALVAAEVGADSGWHLPQPGNTVADGFNWSACL